MAEHGYNLDQLAANWRWLFDPEHYELLAISPFGDLVLQEKSGAVCLLDVNFAEIEYAKDDGKDFARLFPDAFDDRLASRYREAGLVLGEGKCYGYKIPVIVAESSFEPSNVYVATLAEYVSFLGDFHHQIQDVEDGESITLKAIDLPN